MTSKKLKNDIHGHSREGGNPAAAKRMDTAENWMPAFAGMTDCILQSRYVSERQR